MSRKLTDEVSVSEMLQMRENGMSNSDIAKALEVHYSTIVNYIGKQPGRMDHIAAFSDTPKPAPQPIQKAPEPVRHVYLEAVQESFTACGMDVSIDYKAEVVKIYGESTAMEIKTENMVDFIDILSQTLVKIAEHGGKKNA